MLKIIMLCNYLNAIKCILLFINLIYHILLENYNFFQIIIYQILKQKFYR